MERVVIVGGGVLGLMHAVQARRRGLAVVHLEREADARGASVRNFGLIWVSGRAPGPELALALRARAAVGGAGRRGARGRVPAARLAHPGRRRRRAGPAQGGRRPAGRGRARLRAARPGRGPRGEPGAARLVRRRRCCAAATPSWSRGWCPAAIRAHLLAGPGRGAAATTGGPAARRSRWPRTRCATTPASGTAATWSCCATGAAHTGIAGPHLAGYQRPPVRRVRLQMLQTGPFGGRADHLGGRRGLAALLPGLRAARPGPAAAPGAGRRGGQGPAAAGAAAGRQPDHRRHPRVRRAVRVRRRRGGLRSPARPGRAAPRHRAAAPPSAGGPGSTVR